MRILTDRIVSPSLPGYSSRVSRILYAVVRNASCCFHDIDGLVYVNTQPGLRREGQTPEQRLAALEGRPTDFMHEAYYDLQQYPNGVADVVGYWAEYHLFGAWCCSIGENPAQM